MNAIGTARPDFVARVFGAKCAGNGVNSHTGKLQPLHHMQEARQRTGGPPTPEVSATVLPSY